MKIILLILLLVFSECAMLPNQHVFEKANKSVLKSIKKKSIFNDVTNRVYDNRKEVLKLYGLSHTSFDSIPKFVIIDEYDPFAFDIKGEFYFFDAHRSTFKYLQNGRDSMVITTNKVVNGRAKIIEYLNGNDFDGLEQYANEHSKKFSDNSLIFITFYNEKKVVSTVVLEFSWE